MSSRLSKIRSVHTHIMPRTVSFGWIFRKVLLKHSTTVQQRKARVFETTLVLQLVPKNSSQPKMTSFGKNQSFSEFCPAKIAQISENWQKIKDLFYLQNPVEVVKMVNIVTFSVVIINVWRLHLRDFVWWCCSAVVWLKNYQKVVKTRKLVNIFSKILKNTQKLPDKSWISGQFWAYSFSCLERVLSTLKNSKLIVKKYVCKKQFIWKIAVIKGKIIE